MSKLYNVYMDVDDIVQKDSKPIEYMQHGVYAIYI